MAYATILALAVVLTTFALWRPNLLFAICATAAWFGFLAYHNANQPSGVVAGSTVDTFIMLAIIGMALVIPIHTLMVTSRKGKDNAMWGGGERSSDGGFGGGRTSNSTGNTRGSRSPDDRPRGLLDLSQDEYKAYLKGRVRGGRRRR